MLQSKKKVIIMTTTEQTVKQYLEKTFKAHVDVDRWKDLTKLPLFLRERYTLFALHVFDKKMILILDSTDKEEKPSVIKKHMESVEKALGHVPVYAKSMVTAYNRNRLIEKHIPFIVPGKQVFLPNVGLELKDRQRQSERRADHLMPSSQVLLLYHLLGHDQNQPMTPDGMAKRFGYSKMTISRALDDLEKFNLGVHYKNGRNRFVDFDVNRAATWKKALPYLKSPISTTHFVQPEVVKGIGLKSGLTALSVFTILNEPSNEVLAIGRDDWKSIERSESPRELPFLDTGVIQLESWKYDPALLSRSNTVDRLSLYLSLKDSADERIEMALDALLEEIGW